MDQPSRSLADNSPSKTTKHPDSNKWLKIALLIIALLLAISAGAYASSVYWQTSHRTNSNTVLYTPKTKTTNNTPSPVQSSSTTKATPSCSTSDLALSLGQPNGAAGTSYIDLMLKNKSNTACTIKGYPGVSLVDSHDNQLGQAAIRSSTNQPVLITLKSGQSATATMAFPDPGNFSTPGSCSVSSTKLKVYPPDQTSALEVTLAEQSCPGFSVTALIP